MITFPMHSNILLLPHWVVEALQRQGCQTSDILNFTKIRPLLSMNDLLATLALQSYGDLVTGMGRDAGMSANTLKYLWSCTANKADKEYLSNQLEPLEKDPSQRDTVTARLFTAPVHEGSGPYTPPAEFPKAFAVVPLQDAALGIVIYPGHFVGPLGSQQQFPLLRALLKQLYVYEEYSVVSATALNLRYLELLSLQ